MITLSSSSPSPPKPSSFSKPGISGASTVSFNPETSKYTIKFDGKTIETTVTDKAAIVDQWIQHINVKYPPYSFVIVGLDVERNSSAAIKPPTLHLCIDDKCLILQLKYIDNLPLSLKNFLVNPNFFFVAIDVDSYISWIRNDYDLNCVMRSDLRGLARAKCPNRFSSYPVLKDLAKELLGLSIKEPKLVSLSNWDTRVLTVEQVEYGTIDAYVSYKLGNLLLKDD